MQCGQMAFPRRDYLCGDNEKVCENVAFARILVNSFDFRLIKQNNIDWHILWSYNNKNNISWFECKNE